MGIFLFIFGSCLGSFVNVVIYRLPLNQSIVYPNSRCPKCEVKIKWFDNLPIISWLFLRGKCRACKTRISYSYPIVELLTGILVALLISKFLGVDPIIAILGSAPGGTIGMSLVGAEYGLGAAVAALHAVRLITVLLLIPALLNLMGLQNNVNIPK